MSQTQGEVPAPFREKKHEKVPFHEKIKGLIIQSTIGITGGLREVKAGELLVLFSLLGGSKMPAKVAHEFASRFEKWPELLENAGQRELAQVVQGVLEDLQTREGDEPAPSADNAKELSRKLFSLGEHMHLLVIWSQRGDMNPGAVESIGLAQQAFEEVAKVLPPKP